jgi:hypothetical protein
MLLSTTVFLATSSTLWVASLDMLARQSVGVIRLRGILLLL